LSDQKVFKIIYILLQLMTEPGTAFIRPPDIHVGRLIFYWDSFLFLPHTLWAHWTELSQNWPHGWNWVRFENACPKSGVSFPPTNRGPKKHILDDFATQRQF